MKEISYSQFKETGLNVSYFATKFCGISNRQNFRYMLLSPKSRLKALEAFKKGLATHKARIDNLNKALDKEINARRKANRVLSTESN